MTKEQATKAFNENMYFIETLTSKYRTYPNYDDILQMAYLTAWEALLRYDEDNTTKVTTWIQGCYEDSPSNESESSSRHLPASQSECNAEPAINTQESEKPKTKITTWLYANVVPSLVGYTTKELYNGIIKYNNRTGMKILKAIGKGKAEGLGEGEIVYYTHNTL